MDGMPEEEPLSAQGPEGSDAFAELIDLERCPVIIGQVFLDPNNPRFGRPHRVPDSRIEEQSVQDSAREELEKIGINDVVRSIRHYGFVPTDPIVVRQFAPNKYVTLEGNRRVASVKKILLAHEKGEPLDARVLKSLETFQVLVYKGTDENIAWIIQGLRHLVGIREWEPLQQGAFIARIEKEILSKMPKGKRGRPPGIPTVARAIGLGPTKTGNLLRSYFAYKQVKELDDYSEVLQPKKFSIFSEAVFKSTEIQKWLGWSEAQRKFENETNLDRFLSLVLPVNAGEPKIAWAVDVRDVLPRLIARPDMLAKVEEDEMTISAARVALEGESQGRNQPALDLGDVRSELESSADVIARLPIALITGAPSKEDFVALLARIKHTVEQDLAWLGSNSQTADQKNGPA